MLQLIYYIFFFFNDTATTEIYTLSLHDALPISDRSALIRWHAEPYCGDIAPMPARCERLQDRKSTRLNSSHSQISYAVFCLKKKKKNQYTLTAQTTTTSHTNTQMSYDSVMNNSC